MEIVRIPKQQLGAQAALFPKDVFAKLIHGDAYAIGVVDDTAASLYALYCEPVDKAELQPLDLVFSGSPISHVAVVGRDGKIYEAAGSDIGVVCSDSVDTRTVKSIYGGAYGCSDYYKKGSWTAFGRLKILKDIKL